MFGPLSKLFKKKASRNKAPDPCKVQEIQWDINGSETNYMSEEDGLYYPHPPHNSNTGFGFYQDMGMDVGIHVLPRCPSCGSLRHKDGKCLDCGERMLTRYQATDPKLPKAEDARFDVFLDGKQIGGSVTGSQLEDIFYKYLLETTRGQAELEVAAEAFIPNRERYIYSGEECIIDDIAYAEISSICGQGTEILPVGMMKGFEFHPGFKYTRVKNKKRQ